MRIAHISDIHLCRIFKRRNISKLTALIKKAINHGAQHFVFTGDIFDNATEKDFNLFKQILIRHEIYKSEKTTLIIGNHDIFGGPQTASDVINFPSKCSLINYKEKVESFVNYFNELFEGVVRPDKNSLFPFAKEFKDIVLIGVNSIDQYSVFKNPFASNGKVDKQQRKSIDSLLSSYDQTQKVKIVMVHHHFYKNDHEARSSESNLWTKIENYTMKLRGKKKLLKMFNKNGVKMILHGHSHEMDQYYRNGICFLNAGGSMEEENARMFIIDAFPFDIDITLHSVPISSQKTVYDKSIIPVAV